MLSIDGYDAAPIDCVEGAKTKTALARFLLEKKLNSDAVNQPEFFDKLIAAAEHPEGAGFKWWNQTTYPVMAALGIVEMGSIVTRGWYRVPAGQCLRPDVSGEPMRFYSYAEAVDANGAHAAARRRSARLGRKCHAMHAQWPLRTLYPERLRRARLEYGRFRRH